MTEAPAPSPVPAESLSDRMRLISEACLAVIAYDGRYYVPPEALELARRVLAIAHGRDPVVTTTNRIMPPDL
jgi:hypothetical protein